MKSQAVFLFVLLAARALCAQVTLPQIFSSHMVVERELPIHVWGHASPSEVVAVSFRGETREAQADTLGRWSAYMKPGSAGGPFQLIVKGASDRIVLEDVLVGDVWVASGQSNMEFELAQASTASEDLPKTANPLIRLLIVDRKAVDWPQGDVETKGWKVSSQETAKDFSAVGWYFAREIVERENVPVGIIESTWSGTVAEAWTRLTALGEDAALAPVFAQRGKMSDRESETRLKQTDEDRQRKEARAAGNPEPAFPWHPQFESWGPGMLWNGMIAPLTPMAIRGVIWYQGESNSALERAPLYSRIFATTIEDWRRQWDIGDFPFLFVQISSSMAGPQEDWATLREQQSRTLKLRNTAMAVTIDIGSLEDVHPRNKRDVGLRLARAARALSYGEAVEYQGPVYRQTTPEKGALRLWFEHATGLVSKGGALRGFEVAGADGKFVPATAAIEGETIIIGSPLVAVPTDVRYGWANAVQCNLFNGEGLPASPFRTGR